MEQPKPDLFSDVLSRAFPGMPALSEAEVAAKTALDHTPYINTHNQSAELNQLMFRDLYGVQPAAEVKSPPEVIAAPEPFLDIVAAPKIVELSPASKLTDRIIAGVCRFIIRAH